MEFQYKKTYTMEDLRQIVKILRSEEGCPWDREQTHQSIRKNFLEETYEVLEAIDTQNATLLQEELGDVLLQVVFHSQIEEEQEQFYFEEVVTGICQKLIHRHPHVFGDSATTANSEQVLKNWDEIKRKEKHQSTYTETLEQVPKVLPALMRSEQVQKRARRAGFDYTDAQQAFDDLCSEVKELEEAINFGTNRQIDEELGDILFSCVNISRFFAIDSEKSLTNATEKFITRFRNIEQLAQLRGINLQTADMDTLNILWNCAKNAQKK